MRGEYGWLGWRCCMVDMGSPRSWLGPRMRKTAARQTAATTPSHPSPPPDIREFFVRISEALVKWVTVADQGIAKRPLCLPCWREEHPHCPSSLLSSPRKMSSHKMTLMKVLFNPSDDEVTFFQCTKKQKKKYENHLNPVKLVFITSQISTHVPGFQSFFSILLY